MSGRQTASDARGWARGVKGFGKSKDDDAFDASKGSADKAGAKKQFGPTGGGDLIATPENVGDTPDVGTRW
jgi:hypothetical protein